MAKSKERLEARNLRRQGESIKVIANRLHVSPSSVSLWCRDIHLSLEQIKELERKSKDPFYGKRLEYSLSQQKARRVKIEALLKKGTNDIGLLTERELFLVGVALYWAEGFKKDSQAGFACSDSKMVLIFIKWLTSCCRYKIGDLSFRVTLNESHNMRAQEVVNYWIKITGASPKQFQKTYLQKTVWKKTYENPQDYYGVLRVKVRKSTDFLRLISGWIEGMKMNSNKVEDMI